MAGWVAIERWSDLGEDAIWAIRAFAAAHGVELDDGYWELAEEHAPPPGQHWNEPLSSPRMRAVSSILDWELGLEPWRKSGRRDPECHYLMPFVFAVAGQDPPNWAEIRCGDQVLLICSPDDLRDEDPLEDPDEDEAAEMDEKELADERNQVRFGNALREMLLLAEEVRLPVAVCW